MNLHDSAVQPAAADVVHRFPGWELRPQERLLLVGGEPARLGNRAFRVLQALAERPGRVVTKAELLELAWPGLVVEENNLSVQITALRKLLGAGAIVNVSGIGYRLAAAPLPAAGAGPANGAQPPAAVAAPALVGRAPDLAALTALAATSPLLSIVGAGGVGKTSLARALVAALAREPARWRDGVHWIDLAPLRDGAPLATLMAAALGVVLEGTRRTADDFALSLSQLQALIALDNCEHLLDEVSAFVAPLLGRAGGIRWLVTSQAPLHLPGEAVYRLEPLALPQPDADFAAARDCGAVALFCERARAVDRRFELGADNVEAAVAVCRQLDGLPLAIEMAAARVATLGLQGLQQQLGQRLRLRAAPRETAARHHTLRDTFDWSHGLLSAAEQQVFRRLQPFVGGFTANMAQQLCCGLDDGGPPLDEWQALDALSALVDKSLVQRSAGDRSRLHLLESARDYAGLQLAQAHELQAVQRRHAEVVAEWFDAAHADFVHLRDQAWAALCMPERYNVRAALAWACAARQPDLLARLVAALAQIDAFAQTQAEVVQYAVPLDVLAQAIPPLRARAWLGFSWAHYLDGQRELATELMCAALADFETLGDTAGVYGTLLRLTRLYSGRPGMQAQAEATWQKLRLIDEGAVALRERLTCAISVGSRFDGERSVARLQELQDIAQRAGFDAQAAVCRTDITDELLRQGRFDEAVQTARTLLEGEALRPRSQALICHNLALALVQLGRVEEAHAPARITLRALPSGAYLVVDIFALAAARAGRHIDAALMAGCSAQVKRERDLHSEPTEAALIDETLRLLHDALGSTRLAELLRHGAALPMADALAMALPA